MNKYGLVVAVVLAVVCLLVVEIVHLNRRVQDLEERLMNQAADLQEVDYRAEGAQERTDRSIADCFQSLTYLEDRIDELDGGPP